jgi:glycosyltransferase involved in cell wall biosynthesis
MKNRLRILYVQRPAIGGTVTGLYDLVSGLDLNVYEPIVLFLKPSTYCQQFKELGIRVISPRNNFLKKESLDEVIYRRDIAARLKRFSKSLSTGYAILKQFYLLTRKDLVIANRIFKLIKDIGADLVHQNNNLPSDRATVLGAIFAKVPQVCHIRTLKSLTGVEQFLSRHVKAFIYMSNVIEKAYLKCGIPSAKGAVIYDGFDPKNYDILHPKQVSEIKKEFDIQDNEFVVSNVGRLAPWKGQDYFIKAMAKIIKFKPNVKVLIVGPIEPELSDHAYYIKLQRLIEELQISKNIIFTGFRNDIFKLMAASDIIVHSSSEPEPFGRVVVEGMLARKPVIATAAGGVLDIIKNNVTGLLVPIKDTESMANAISYLMDNPEIADKISDQAQVDAKRRFNVRQHAKAVQRVYDGILRN